MRSLLFRGHCPSELRVCPALLKPCSRSRIRENSADRSPPNSHEFGYEGRGMPKGFNRARECPMTKKKREPGGRGPKRRRQKPPLERLPDRRALEGVMQQLVAGRRSEAD